MSDNDYSETDEESSKLEGNTKTFKQKAAGVQPRWILGIRSGDGVRENQETTV